MILDEDKKIETKVETTEWFRTKKSAGKLIGIVIVGISILYFFITVFGGYFFLSFFFYLFVIFVVFSKLYKAPGELFIECKVGSSKDKDSEGDVISISRIPHKLLEEGYKSKGANVQKLKTKSGNNISIVEEIDDDTMTIKWAWYAQESSFNFYAKKTTFFDMKELVTNLMDDIMKAKETRALYHKMEIMKMLDDMERRKDISELEKEFSGVSTVDKQ